MGSIKEISIKNRTYYFFNDAINIKNFDSNLLKMDKNSYKATGIHFIAYITIRNIGDYESIHSVNPFYFTIIGKIDGYIKRKKRK